MDTQESQELLLDDIMREFKGSPGEPPAESSLEDILREFAPEKPAGSNTIECEAPISEAPPSEAQEPPPEAPEPYSDEWEPEYKEPPGEPSPEPSLEDILREFAPEKPAPAGSDTIEFETPISEVPAPEAQEPPAEASEAPEAAAPAAPEPYSDEWEPEYEEPMGEYRSQDPIPFPPKNRLRLLRQKLVAGPEKRFYELSALGLGRLRLGVMLNLILCVLSAAATTAHGEIGAERLLTFSQLLLMMLSALVGCYRLLEGLGSLLRGRFTLNTLLLATFAACMADGFFCLQSQRLPCCTLFCLDMLMSQWAALQRRGALLSQTNTLRKAPDLTAVVKIPDFYEGRPGYKTAEGDPDSYTENCDTPSMPEKSLSLYALAALLASLLMAVLAGVSRGLDAGMQAMSAALLIAVPATAFISVTRPAAILERRLSRLGTVLCGWQGIHAAGESAVFPLDHDDLFPEGTIKMNGVKFYGTVDPGRVVSYTTALIHADGSGLMPAFSRLPRSRKGLEQSVEDFASYPGGVSGAVEGDAVLVGTAECMEAAGIQIPPDAKVPLAVYTAVNGQFSGVFVLSCSRSKSSAAGLRILCGCRKITPVLTACDFMLTHRFIGSRLSVSLRRVVFPDRDTRQALSRISPAADAPVIALTTKEGLAPKACAVSGARMLGSAMKTGAMIHILGGTLGLLAVAVLLLSDGLALLSPGNLLLYSAVWMIPGFLVTEWTRYL